MSRAKCAVVGAWCALAMFGVWHRSALAQTAPPTEPAAIKTGSSDALPIFRAPLMREGSAILDVRATIHKDPQRGWWTITLPATRANVPPSELTLLPCTRLSEMQRIVEASPNRRVEFQVSGRVCVYRGRNYLLPTYAPVIEEQETVVSIPPASDPNSVDDTPATATQAAHAVPSTNPSDAPPVANASPDAQLPASDSAADIMREIEQASGPLTQNPTAAGRSASPQPSTDSVPPAPDEVPTERAAGASGSSNGGGTGNSNGLTNGRLIAEESSVVNRRGKITRDSSGGWLFVFDADATGLADPPLRLLPCLLLERIEDYARRQGNNSPALISGTMYLYSGRNYLMPTVFRIPHERRNLSP